MFNRISTRSIRNYRAFSQLTKDGQTTRNFEQMVSDRKHQSSKSVVIQVLSSKSYPDLFSYCSQFGKIRKSFYFENTKAVNQILFEYESVDGANAVIKSAIINGNRNLALPLIHSRFIYFGRCEKNKPLNKFEPIPLQSMKSILNDPQEFVEILQNADTISDQMNLLYENTCLNDLAIRLRFIAAQQIEDFFRPIFSEVEVYPFGSSVNGFGKLGSDLDLIMQTNSTHKNTGDSRLFINSKGYFDDLRQKQQFQISLMGTMVSELLPGIANTIPITKARIPIVKYYHELLDLPVDISVSNMSGYYMSEFLYLLGEIDERVRPFIFAIRLWAKIGRITGDGYNNMMTNFPLTCLAICFLQRLAKPILPTLGELKSTARNSDIRITEDNIHYTFLRDLSKIEFKSENNDSLEDLLSAFFEFVSEFNFKMEMLSLNNIKNLRKLDSSPMIIENPFEIELNVCRAVKYKDLERMKMIANRTLDILNKSPKSAKEPWGLLTFSDKI